MVTNHDRAQTSYLVCTDASCTIDSFRVEHARKYDVPIVGISFLEAALHSDTLPSPSDHLLMPRICGMSTFTNDVNESSFVPSVGRDEQDEEEDVLLFSLSQVTAIFRPYTANDALILQQSPLQYVYRTVVCRFLQHCDGRIAVVEVHISGSGSNKGNNASKSREERSTAHPPRLYLAQASWREGTIYGPELVEEDITQSVFSHRNGERVFKLADVLCSRLQQEGYHELQLLAMHPLLGSIEGKAEFSSLTNRNGRFLDAAVRKLTTDLHNAAAKRLSMQLTAGSSSGGDDGRAQELLLNSVVRNLTLPQLNEAEGLLVQVCHRQRKASETLSFELLSFLCLTWPPLL